MPQRSPLIFWLLLAATICVDAVVISWMTSESNLASLFVAVTFYALILSQLSVVCIWSAFRETKTVWTRIAPLLASILATLLAILIETPEALLDSFMNHFAYYGLHAALVLATLWLLRAVKRGRIKAASRNWQFSLLHLLGVMTVVAVLAALLRNSPFFSDDPWLNVAFAVSSVALTTASVFFGGLSCHWLLRLVGVVGCALLLSGALMLGTELYSGTGRDFHILIGALYLIQALVLSIWLAWGQIIPVANAPAGATDEGLPTRLAP